ncbi:hypothetical protein VTK56DRAFT_3866 [Thermocarpiscus australiensis]
MRLPTYLLALLALPLTAALALDLVFHQAHACNAYSHASSPSLRCVDLPPHHCCPVAFPWCGGVMECDGCLPGDYLVAFRDSVCGGEARASCVETSLPATAAAAAAPNHTGCCLSLEVGDEGMCAGLWEAGTARDGADPVVRRVKAMVGTWSSGRSGTGECKGVREPSVMSYVDGGGVRRNIHLPEGSLARATEMYMASDFEGLASAFDEWFVSRPRAPTC